MKLQEQLKDYVNAAYTGIWLQSCEPDEAERELRQLAGHEKWKIATWDVAAGLRLLEATKGTAIEGANDPLAVLRALPALAEPEGTVIMALHQFHRFLGNPEVVQTLFTNLIAGKHRRTIVVILSPVVQIPIELEKLFVVIEHPLPDRNQLEKIVRDLTNGQPEPPPNGIDLQRVLDAASGLTRYEAEGAFALSLARHGGFQPEAIWEMKAQALKKNNMLTLHRGSEHFESIGGLASLKLFCQRALEPGKKVRAKGVLLLGVPGTGKSAFCKALGNETGRPTLLLDLGSLLGSLVGQSEANIRQALRIADAMAPAILFVDELEKALGGVGGQGDSGVSTRMFGTLLTYLSDHESDVFFVATSNDISKLPPEFTRAERFDGVFFLDLPTAKDRDAIWDQYRLSYQIPVQQNRPDDTNWTGAEIRSCCRLAALLDVPLTQSALQVVPVAVTAAEQIAKLRTWANGRCLSASEPGIYGQEGQKFPRTSRRVQRGPSDN